MSVEERPPSTLSA
uniref:Uncharacterized protein n=1 Tax=Arundo donax TaxID=35708 RepID=A0A0A9C0X3_ARUDO